MKRLLIVDDIEQNLYMLETLLKGSGYEVESASNGQEALEKARKNLPDMIITDILMPVMDGFALCRKWKKDDRLKKIPLVFYTATYTDPKDEKFALSLGAERFIVKPKEPDEFLNILQDVIKEQEEGRLFAPQAPVEEETIRLKEYNEVLIHKLEAKLEQLEVANKSLEREISERKQVEASLKESEERFRQLYERTPLGYQSLDENGHFIEVNQAWLDTLGYEKEEVIGKSFGDFLSSGWSDHFKENFPRFKTVGEILGVEFEMIKKDGSKILVSFHGKIGKDNKGNFKQTHCILHDITELKKTNEIIRETLLRQNEAVKAANVGLWDWDLVTNKVRYSAEWKRQIGYEEHEINNDFKEWEIRVHPDDLEPTLEKIQHSIAEVSQDHKVEFRFRHKDGFYCWILAQGSIFQDESGRPIKMMGSHIDITELKIMEEDRKEFERRYLELMQESRDGFAMLDKNGQFVLSNAAYTNMLGYTEEGLKKKMFSDITPEEYHSLDEMQFEQVLKRGFSDLYEKAYQRSDGTIFPVEIRSYIIKDSKDKFDGTWSYVRDITERKRAEKIDRQKTQEIAIVSAITSQVSSSLSLEEVVKAAINGMVRASQPDLAMIFLREGERLLLKRTHAKEPTFNHKETPVHRVGECLCGLAVSMKKALYSKNIHHDPRCAWEECKKAGLQSFAALPLVIRGEAIGVIGLATKLEHDFETHAEFFETLASQIAVGMQNALLYEEVKKYTIELELRVEKRTDELTKANIKLKELDQLKSMFIASMSHELRTPLNSIIGFTGIILQGMSGEINDEQKDQLQRVYRSGKHLLALIGDVIDISKIEAGKIEPYIEELELQSVIDEAIATFTTEIDKKDLDVETSIPEGMLLKTDRKRLLQCLLNYLSNACKFSEKGTISLVAREVNELAEIIVTDMGIGIKEDDQAKLFSPFVRIDSPLKTATLGTGLGLYLTKKLATEVLNGSVSAESSYGAGSRFTLKIPLRI